MSTPAGAGAGAGAPVATMQVVCGKCGIKIVVPSRAASFRCPNCNTGYSRQKAPAPNGASASPPPSTTPPLPSPRGSSSSGPPVGRFARGASLHRLTPTPSPSPLPPQATISSPPSPVPPPSVVTAAPAPTPTRSPPAAAPPTAYAPVPTPTPVRSPSPSPSPPSSYPSSSFAPTSTGPAPSSSSSSSASFIPASASTPSLSIAQQQHAHAHAQAQAAHHMRSASQPFHVPPTPSSVTDASASLAPSPEDTKAAPRPDDPELFTVVKLNVGGHLYMTTVATLLKSPPTSRLYSHFSNGKWANLADETGWIFYDRNGAVFGSILSFLRDGYVLCDPALLLPLKQEAVYFRLPALVARVEEQLTAHHRATAIGQLRIDDLHAYIRGVAEFMSVKPVYPVTPATH